ncbi:hypothetical protein [Pseudomonas sp. FEN]|uniref:hypothetical protein n=1 Tax=Pseudomonas sp. FEN TaxID=2767468 RepID=UPI00174E1673|nr:hypothetical protein [Pseudomonas sp. FEN]
MRVSYCFIVSIAAGLVACKSSMPEPGAVAKNWSENTQQLGIQAIYPPRGNVYIGDIYMSRAMIAGVSPPPSFYSVPPQWYDHIDLTTELEAIAPTLNVTKMDAYNDGQGTAAKKTWQLPELTRAGNDKRLNSLVAFPGFTFASVSESQIGVNVTNSAVKAFLSGGRKSSYSVAYSVPAAEVYGVPYMAAKAKFLARSSTYDPADMRSFSSSCEYQPVMVLITEVYSARAIDVAVSAQDGFSAQTSAAVTRLANLSTQNTATTQEINQVNAAPQGPEMSNKVTALKANQEAIQAEMRALTESIVPNLPGVTGSVVRSSSNGITLQQVFQLPVVVGYRGVNFSLQTGCGAIKTGSGTVATTGGAASSTPTPDGHGFKLADPRLQVQPLSAPVQLPTAQ